MKTLTHCGEIISGLFHRVIECSAAAGSLAAQFCAIFESRLFLDVSKGGIQRTVFGVKPKRVDRCGFRKI